jgi:hypothetical protein
VLSDRAVGAELRELDPVDGAPEGAVDGTAATRGAAVTLIERDAALLVNRGSVTGEAVPASSRSAPVARASTWTVTV